MSNELEKLNLNSFKFKSVDEKLDFMRKNINNYYTNNNKSKVKVIGPNGEWISVIMNKKDPVCMLKFHWLSKKGEIKIKKNTKDVEVDIWSCIIQTGRAGNTTILDTDNIINKSQIGTPFYIRTKEQAEKPRHNKIIMSLSKKKH